MTLKELKKQIEEINKKIKELEKQENKKGYIWKPNLNEEYYFIKTDGDILSDINNQAIIDNFRIDRGNYYKTKEEAEYQAKVQKYTNLFRKYVEEHSEPIDWGNQHKWALVYNTHQGEMDYHTEPVLKYQGAIYASSKEVLQEAIDFVGKENVIKYVLGVKNEIN